MNAEIRKVNGMPTLFIDGEQQVPMLLFTNTEADGGARRDICKVQIRQALEKGLHLHSVCCHIDLNTPTGERDLSPAIGAMDTVIDEDPCAAILLRVNLSLYGAEAEKWELTHPGDCVRYALHSEDYPRIQNEDGSWRDNTFTAVSIASEDWLREAIATLKQLNDWFLEHPKYYDRLLGYHIAAEDAGEWFHPALRENGVDISAANRKAWQDWLFKKYWPRAEDMTDAWNLNPKYCTDFSEVEVPYDIPGNDRSRPMERSLFTRSLDQRFIDYGDYSSELTVDRIKKMCNAVKEMTNGQKITLVFYGYYYELYDARTGHFALNELLDCPDLDAFAGPISYLDRNEGGTSAVMAPVDSMALHGKLWLQENDMRTGQVLRDHGPNDLDGWLSKPFTSVEHVLSAYEREWAHMMSHGMGCWYMDLPARGWISHPRQWDKISALVERSVSLQSLQSPLNPDVAVVVDEKAMSVVAHAEEVGARLLYCLRQNFYRAGIKFGWYTAEDVENGLVPSAKLIWYLTPFRLNAQRAEKLRKLAAEQGATIVFIHGFGVTPPAVIHKLTGMKINRLDGILQNLDMKPTDWWPQDKKLLPDEEYLRENIICPFYWNPKQMADPAYFVEPEDGVEVLAYYTEGHLRGRIGAARCCRNGVTSVFVGAYYLTVDGIREICRMNGIHIYSESNDALIIGDHVLAIHADSNAGKRTVKLKKVTAAENFCGEPLEAAQTLTFDINSYDTVTLIASDDTF